MNNYSDFLITPRKYQIDSVNSVAIKVGQGIKRIIFQMATGGGKTVSFSYLISRYLSKFDKPILLLVHRNELAVQAANTFKKFGISEFSYQIEMVEKANNRLKKYSKTYERFGMIIIDECHIGNFRKLLTYFNDKIIIGFSATPISASKKLPLKDEYETIVCSIDIKELIEQGFLAQNVTYSRSLINNNNLVKKGNDYDEKIMSDEYSKSKNVQNVVDVYKQYSLGKKTIVFNCNIKHNDLVNQAFLDSGYNSKVLTGTCKDRKEKLEWFSKNDNAILCNVGVATTGFDEPTILTVIVNRSTLSLPLWLQMCGRGSRKIEGKDYFTILDLGGNAVDRHGDWDSQRDWEKMFYFPQKAGDGVAPVKECDNCNALIAASLYVCKICGHVHTKKETIYDIEPLFLEKINVLKIVEVNALGNYNIWRSLHVIKDKLIKDFKNHNGKELNEYAYKNLSDLFQLKVKEWAKIENKSYTSWVKRKTQTDLDVEILKRFNLQFNLIEKNDNIKTKLDSVST